MNKVLKYFKENIPNNLIIRNIRVYGFQFEYDHLLISSLSNYLFEDINIEENIAPIGNENRDGRIRDKFYITVHDTGDSLYSAKSWSEAVYTEEWENKKYACSFQYVTGNDGIYHNIPDNEIAYHAGDTTMFDYKLYDAKVVGENEKPIITISNDGYYEIDGKKSEISAPRAILKKGGEIIYDRIATTKDINDQGILCKNIDGKYYIGETYFNQGYQKICNRGGNNNSIGIESCINVGTDIYYTWQKTAKLVAKLLHENKLSFDDIKQHHYFSGKNCPQTMRMNGLWEHFLCLVKTEYKIQEFIEEGYKINLIVDNEIIKSNGRICLKDLTKKYEIPYKIQTIKDSNVEEIELLFVYNK